LPNLPPIAATRALAPEGQSIIRFWEQLCRLSVRGDALVDQLALLDLTLRPLEGTAVSLRALTARSVVVNAALDAAVVDPNDPTVFMPEGEKPSEDPGTAPGGGGTPELSPPGDSGADPTGGDIPPLNQLTWLHTDISGWAQTSTIEKVLVQSSQICINHSKAGQWPVFVNGGVEAEGNPWVVAQVGGTWYAATYEWLRPGQICKGITAANIGPHIKKSPLNTWVPQAGELVGFMVSTRARDGVSSGDERSNLVSITWPSF